MQTITERRDYQRRYQQDNTEVWNIRLSKIYDADIIDGVKQMSDASGLSRSEVLKQLIRGQSTMF